jgi:MGT family glycosyltransferase
MYDYILYDAQTLAGTWIAKRLNLPSISTWTVFASLSPSRMMKQMLEKNKHLMERFNHMKEQFLQSKDRIEAKYGIALAPPPQSMMCEGDLNIVFTSQHLQGDVPQSGAPYLFVGPSIADRKDQGDFPIHKLKEGPVVFISLGTIANNHPAFYRLCFEALNDLDALVVLSIGNNLKVEELEPFPDNFIVRNYVPQLDVLRHADAFVTHCGMNSTHEGLYYHVPLVMLPLVNDQPIVAERVKQLGAGILLDFNHLDAATLKNAVGEALSNPVYKRNAQRIGKSFREAGGYVKAADEILKFVNQ